jgi:hypothetical protein
MYPNDVGLFRRAEEEDNTMQTKDNGKKSKSTKPIKDLKLQKEQTCKVSGGAAVTGGLFGPEDWSVRP